MLDIAKVVSNKRYELVFETKRITTSSMRLLQISTSSLGKGAIDAIAFRTEQISKNHVLARIIAVQR